MNDLLLILLKNGVKKIIPITKYSVSEEGEGHENYITYTKLNNVETTVHYDELIQWHVVPAHIVQEVYAK